MSTASQIAKQIKPKPKFDVPKGKNPKWKRLRCCLREIRKKLNPHFTQSIVAKYLGLQTSRYCAIEKGSSVELNLALRIAAFFAVSVEEIWQTETPITFKK